MKTRTQSIIVAGTMMGILLILVLSLTSINYLVSLRKKIDVLNQQHLAKVVVLHKMSRIVRERSLRMYAMYFSEDIWVRDEEYLRFHALARDFVLLRDQLMKLGLQTNEREEWEKAVAIIRITEPLQDSIVEKLYLGNINGVGTRISEEDLPQENQLLEHFDNLLNVVQAETDSAVNEAEGQFVNAIRLLVIITIGVISLSIGVMVFVRKRILQVEGSLHEEKELAQLTLENSINGVIQTDFSGRIISMNPAGEHITRQHASEVVGRKFGEVMNLLDQVSGQAIDWQDLLRELSGTVMPAQRFLKLQLASGSVCLVEISVSPIFTTAGGLAQFAYIFRDVTIEKKQADEVSWQATHDPLTQVLNRNAIISAIKQAVISASRYKEQHVLLYIDLDDFKNVNDRYGHAAGDELLVGICREMEQCVRKGDRIARMGGDEFAILLLDCDLGHAVNSAEKIRHNVSRYCFEFDGKKVCCGGLSIGVRGMDAQTRDWKGVIEQADQACYTAKRQGKNQVSVG